MCLSGHLLEQFLTDRARSGTCPIDSEFYRECPEQKKFEKTLNNICKTRTGGQFFANPRDLVITVKLAQFLTD